MPFTDAMRPCAREKSKKQVTWSMKWPWTKKASSCLEAKVAEKEWKWRSKVRSKGDCIVWIAAAAAVRPTITFADVPFSRTGSNWQQPHFAAALLLGANLGWLGEGPSLKVSKCFPVYTELPNFQCNLQQAVDFVENLNTLNKVLHYTWDDFFVFVYTFPSIF